MTSRILKGGRRAADDVAPELRREQQRREAAERALVELRMRFEALEAEVEVLRHDAAHDPLTGLPNRRALETRLKSTMAAARRHGHALTVCVLDLDGFKQINDGLGHVAGDRVLAGVGAALREALRAEDLAARLGGDEFCLVFPHTAEAEAVRVVERVRARVAAAGDVAVTATFGVAELAPEHREPSALIEAADLALYRAKRAGKNRTGVHRRAASPLAPEARERAG